MPTFSASLAFILILIFADRLAKERDITVMKKKPPSHYAIVKNDINSLMMKASVKAVKLITCLLAMIVLFRSTYPLKPRSTT